MREFAVESAHFFC